MLLGECYNQFFAVFDYDSALVFDRRIFGVLQFVCDAAYIAHLNELSSSYWPLIGLFVFGALGAVIGGFIARRMMKKHFERIGLVR